MTLFNHAHDLWRSRISAHDATRLHDVKQPEQTMWLSSRAMCTSATKKDQILEISFCGFISQNMIKKGAKIEKKSYFLHQVFMQFGQSQLFKRLTNNIL
jgi:hypothetical protein